MVDNLANGVGARNLTLEEIDVNRAVNAAALRATIEAILPALE